MALWLGAASLGCSAEAMSMLGAPCTSSRQCGGLACDTSVGRCVECVTDADCLDAVHVCRASYCVAGTPPDSGTDAASAPSDAGPESDADEPDGAAVDATVAADAAAPDAADSATDVDAATPDAATPCVPACASGETCVAGTCELLCGHSGEACCIGDTCNAGYVCSAGSCVVCGLDGGPCCGGVCGSGLVCGAGTCSACGDPSEPCCTGSACNTGAVCAGGSCVACGSDGDPCCYGSVCDSGLYCSVTGHCQACGTLGAPCCPGGNTCMGTAQCAVGGICRASCGAYPEPCCLGGTCTGAMEHCTDQTGTDPAAYCVQCQANGTSCAGSASGYSWQCCSYNCESAGFSSSCQP